jgi:hypothetical protein
MKIEYKNEPVEIVISHYVYSDNKAKSISLICEDGIPYAHATVNIEGYDYGENEVTIKNYSENEGILEVLIENGIVSEPKGYVDNGYVTVPVCDLLIEGEYIGYCKITS